MKHSLLFKLCFLICTIFSSLGLSAQEIEQSAKNQLSETTIAYTYKLKGTQISSPIKDDVQQTAHQEKKEISFFIDKFLADKEVSEATFDQATQTFTVIATTLAKLNLTYTNQTAHE